MKRAFLLPLLLLLVSAAPATRPAAASTERLVVQMRHVEYTPKPDQAELDSQHAMTEIPARARELTSLQVLADPGALFEAVAIVNGTRYSLTGKFTKPMKADGKDYVRVEFDFRDEKDGIMQVKSNVMVEVNKEIRMGGFMREPNARELILSLKRPEVAPAP